MKIISILSIAALIFVIATLLPEVLGAFFFLKLMFGT